MFPNNFRNPTPLEDTDLGFKWDPVDRSYLETDEFAFKCLEITEQPKMVLNPNKARMDFWKTIYTKWNTEYLKPKL